MYVYIKYPPILADCFPLFPRPKVPALPLKCLFPNVPSLPSPKSFPPFPPFQFYGVSEPVLQSKNNTKELNFTKDTFHLLLF